MRLIPPVHLGEVEVRKAGCRAVETVVIDW